MQYGDLKLSVDNLFMYMGTNPANDNITFMNENSLRPSSKAVNQRDADLVHFWDKVYMWNSYLLNNQFCCFDGYVMEAIFSFSKKTRPLSCSCTATSAMSN